MMPFFAKATPSLPYADGADDERRQLEDKHSRLIYMALRKLMRLVAPADTTTTNITPDIAVQRYRDNQHILRDALVAMLTDGAMLGADVGKAQNDAAMGVGARKATPTITGVDWDLINDDVLTWVTGGGLGGSSFGQGYADTLAAAMAGTSERGLRTLVSEWVRNDLNYRQLVTDLERSLFSRSRAEMVASTEITKAYAEGNRAAWVRGGIIEQMQWFTASDERRCPVCASMHGQIADVRGSFGSGLFPPAHPRCRCFLQPWIGDVVATSVASPDQLAPVALAVDDAPLPVLAVEREIRNSQVEHLYAFKTDGALIGHVVGDAIQVDALTDVADAIVTHNHPANPAKFDYAPSLAVQDIHQALSQGVAEIRAVSAEYTYSMRFDSSIRNDRRWASDFEARSTEVRLDIGDEMREQGKTKTFIAAEREHLLWTQMTKEYTGQIDYRRIAAEEYDKTTIQ